MSILQSWQQEDMMDTTISGALLAAQPSTEAVGMTVLKKANEADAATAMQLVAASSSNLPDHLGNYVNTVA